MSNVGLSSPWVLYYRKVETLFKGDPDVRVELDDENYELKLYVKSAVKADALDKLLPSIKEFGNVELKITVVPADDEASKIYLIKNALYGNKAFSKIIVKRLFENDFAYVMFHKEVAQYYSDNLSDPNGNTSTLYQNLAAEVFGLDNGVYFCTEDDEE